MKPDFAGWRCVACAECFLHQHHIQPSAMFMADAAINPGIDEADALMQGDGGGVLRIANRRDDLTKALRLGPVSYTHLTLPTISPG